MAAVAPVGWGFIGAGGVARRRMLPALVGQPGVLLSAVQVRDQARAEALAGEFGVLAAYDTVGALLDDPRVEAVYIATPPNLHAAHVAAAAAAGKHILLEKPMATTLADCDRILAAVAAAGVRLAVCLPLRHSAAVRALREWLSGGHLGELTYLRCQMAKWYALEPGAWRADPQQAGGGVLMDLGSHLLDLARWLGGEVAAVGASLSTRVWPTPVEDTALIQVRYASGALGSLEMSFAAHDSENAIEVYGTAGYALSRSPREGDVLRRVVAGCQEETQPPAVNVYRAEVEDFGTALRTGRPAATSGADGWVNNACLAAAYESHGSGRFVEPARLPGAP